MSTQVSYLTNLPVETLEQIFLHLSFQDVVKMEAVSRYFRDISRDSPILQHRRELFTAGLINNPSVSCDLVQCRKAYEEYAHKWSDAGRAVKSVHKLPPELFSESRTITILGRNLLASHGSRDYGVAFVRVPSAVVQKPIEWWTIPPFPFIIWSFATHIPENVLAVTEVRERWIDVHLLNLSDGSPYCTPPSDVIRWSLPPDVNLASVGRFSMTSSRIMMYVSLREAASHVGRAVGRILVWDWKTGDLVLDFSSIDGRKFAEWNTKATFLDEFRIIVSTFDRADFPEFILFNTLILQDHPGSERRFRVPVGYRNWTPSFNTDRNAPSGTLNQGPLIVDPTQAFFVLEASGGNVPGNVFVVLRIEALIERACSMSTGTYIPWKDWGRDAMVMEMPVASSPILVQGIHVIKAEMRTVLGDDMRHMCLRIFDFSRRGRSTLWDESAEAMRTTWYEEGRDLFLEGSENVTQWGFKSLGDGTFCHLDRDSSSADLMLHVWELI